jgi:hypothetical protein
MEIRIEGQDGIYATMLQTKKETVPFLQYIKPAHLIRDAYV